MLKIFLSYFVQIQILDYFRFALTQLKIMKFLVYWLAEISFLITEVNLITDTERLYMPLENRCPNPIVNI